MTKPANDPAICHESARTGWRGQYVTAGTMGDRRVFSPQKRIETMPESSMDSASIHALRSETRMRPETPTSSGMRNARAVRRWGHNETLMLCEIAGETRKVSAKGGVSSRAPCTGRRRAGRTPPRRTPREALERPAIPDESAEIDQVRANNCMP